ncbi:NAD(P)/FAD-dependent oxidoreductase [Stagnihabitans tardus]|uniref:FAD-dependent oxidoreductase n=1 Tax=Stagnihabitans tardus TaxID=2699202 RepID=A0AAE4Y7T4_9RHOB|nr:FAD-dependent oxidoreductase [Stagnihabitans tardus]NBZ87403.1 FAD-dependent oxidoreductase [Stagnihabitans tardus]
MARHDLTVMGGGIMGLSCAWEAVRRGLRVQVVERAGIGAGASGGLVGALAPHAPEQWNAGKAFQLEALLMAEAHWTEVAEASGLSPGYARTGRLQPILDASALDLARQREAQAATLWQGRAAWSVIPAGGAFSPASPTGFLIHDTLTARLSPRQALAALAQALREKGARIAQEAEPEGAVIWATGHQGLAELSQALGRKIGQGVKGQALSLRLPGFETHPQVYAEGLYIVPHEDGSIAIGSTSENTYTHEDTDAQADALLAKARALIPALQEAPEITRWAGIRPRAQSRQPLIGAWPLRPGHFIANGGFKIGFAVAPLCAKLLIDAIEGKDEIPDTFRP